jgi:hypothetical protein
MKEKKKNSVAKKLIPATSMLLVSATMLATSTYAWFTMNKEVSVTGMEVKAHAEEGLLINEVAAYDDDAWDALANANTTPETISLRPASTSNLTTFWHANSKKSYDEAGVEDLDATVDIAGGKYLNVTAGQTGIEDEARVAAASAEGNSKAETHVYYKDASFGTDDQYDDGEGFYVKYTYYLKSSGDEDLDLDDLRVRVKATKKTTAPAGTTTDLEKSLRVGVTMLESTANAATSAGYLIFAPVNGGDLTYDVTTVAAGTTTAEVTAIGTTATGTATAYTKLNATNKTITIPNVNSNGIPVQVFVWFEGEDQNCMSDNLDTVLSTYDIDIDFQAYDISAY